MGTEVRDNKLKKIFFWVMENKGSRTRLLCASYGERAGEWEKTMSTFLIQRQRFHWESGTSRDIKMVWARNSVRLWRERCSRCLHSKFMYFFKAAKVYWKIKRWTTIRIWGYTNGNKVSSTPPYTLLNHPSNPYSFIEQILFEFLFCARYVLNIMDDKGVR